MLALRYQPINYVGKKVHCVKPSLRREPASGSKKQSSVPCWWGRDVNRHQKAEGTGAQARYVDLREVIERPTPILRGWSDCFHTGDAGHKFNEVDS